MVGTVVEVISALAAVAASLELLWHIEKALSFMPQPSPRPCPVVTPVEVPGSLRESGL